MRLGSQLQLRLLQRCSPALVAFLCLNGVAFAQAKASKGTDASVGGLIVASGFIGWLIIALSVLGLTLAIEAFVTLKREKLAPPEMIDDIQALFEEGEYQEAMSMCEEDPNFFSRVTGAGLAKLGHPFDVIETAISEMGDEESIKLHQKIGYIALVANVAPMMGLLGTVQGMIVTFNQIANSGGQASPAELAGGISMALLTTLFGLLVAIPMTAVFTYLKNRLVRSVIEVGAIIEDLFERFREKTA